MLTNHQIFVISSPSGGGKKTIIDEVLRCDNTLRRTKSVTTRQRLAGDADEYYFTNNEDFESKVKEGYFVEYEEVYPGKFYGTPRRELFMSARCVVEIEVNGARQIKKAYPEQVYTIFLLPDSPETLEKRLRERGRGETEDEIRRRLSRATMEIEAASEFDHWVTNDDLKKCVSRVGSIILTHSLNRHGRSRLCRDYDELNRVRVAFSLPVAPVLV